MRIFSRSGVAALWLMAAWLQGCRPAAPGQPLPLPVSVCVVSDTPARPELRVQVFHSSNPLIPTAQERLIPAQLYETLVNLDCQGRVLPGLAESWQVSEQGRVWRFRLRSDATWWDDTPVTAAEIIQGWAGHPVASARTTALFANLSAAGERELHIELRTPLQRPSLFAHPDLGAIRMTTQSNWPVGSGYYRLASVTDEPATRIVARQADAALPAALAARGLETADARRALDAGSDIVITSDLRTLEYARALTGFSTLPLPWNRTYTLATAILPELSPAAAPPADAFAAFRDAVPADARSAQAPFWWQDAGCAAAPAATTRAPERWSGHNTIVYPSGDPVARALAERLVALAWPVRSAPAWLRALLPGDYGRSGAPRAEGVPALSLPELLRDYRALAVVIALPRLEGDACAAVFWSDAPASALVAAAHWRSTPLIDTRDHFIYRKGLGRVTYDALGTIRFQPQQP